MNVHDSEHIAGLLEADGMTQADGLEDADVVLFNTCCIRENADTKLYGSLGMLKEYKDSNPNLLIAVAGCLAQKDRELIRQKADYVDVVFGTHNMQRAAELINYARENGPIVEILEETVQQDIEDFSSPLAVPVTKRSEDHKAWVTIQIGCDNSCAFCIVPSVRGPEISRSLEDIIFEIQELANNGVKEVTLLGQNVNSYGRDLALKERKSGNKDIKLRPHFSKLLKAVSAVEGISRVRFTSPHPKDILLETINTMSETQEICEHLHLPLQSGSNKILKAMHRGYTVERYLKRLEEARENIEDLAVTSDIIVGFPGETEADFEETLKVAASVEYDSVHAFIFSPRPGTEANEMTEDFIDSKIISDRFKRLKIVLDHSAHQKHKARIGHIEEVLVDGVSQKDPQKSSGRTRQHKLVHWETGDQAFPAGSLVMVEIQEAAPYFLKGEMKEVISIQETIQETISSVKVDLLVKS